MSPARNYRIAMETSVSIGETEAFEMNERRASGPIAASRSHPPGEAIAKRRALERPRSSSIASILRARRDACISVKPAFGCSGSCHYLSSRGRPRPPPRRVTAYGGAAVPQQPGLPGARQLLDDIQAGLAAKLPVDEQWVTVDHNELRSRPGEMPAHRVAPLEGQPAHCCPVAPGVATQRRSPPPANPLQHWDLKARPRGFEPLTFGSVADAVAEIWL